MPPRARVILGLPPAARYVLLLFLAAAGGRGVSIPLYGQEGRATLRPGSRAGALRLRRGRPNPILPSD